MFVCLIYVIRGTLLRYYFFYVEEKKAYCFYVAIYTDVDYWTLYGISEHLQSADPA